MKGRSAFSLLEAILTVFIFSLVLSALAYSLGQLSRVSLARQDFGLELEAVQVTQLVRDDARNATQAELGAGWIQFTGQDLEQPLATRIEQGMTATPSLATVRYEFTEGWLYRTRTDGNGQSQTAPMAELAAFEIEPSGRLATVRFAFSKLNKVEHFEARLKLP
ncbi:MAG: hypothetical protein WC314_22050 [Vulcanimicrobiota bacterium]